MKDGVKLHHIRRREVSGNAHGFAVHKLSLGLMSWFAHCLGLEIATPSGFCDYQTDAGLSCRDSLKVVQQNETRLCRVVYKTNYAEIKEG
jgi:hypothetical protein